MSKTRSVLGLLHALLLLLAGAAGYAYLNFSQLLQLLQQQLPRQLPESGLQELQYQHPQLCSVTVE